MTTPEPEVITKAMVDRASVEAAEAIASKSPDAERLTNEANRLWTLWTFQQEDAE